MPQARPRRSQPSARAREQARNPTGIEIWKAAGRDRNRLFNITSQRKKKEARDLAAWNDAYLKQALADSRKRLTMAERRALSKKRRAASAAARL